MSQPKGFVDSRFPNYVCKLQKALYGLKQAPRAWFNKLKVFLQGCGFHACFSDTSLFVLHTVSAITYVLVYVDDIIVTGFDSVFIGNFIRSLNHIFALKDLGPLSFFLGIEVTYTESTIHLSQYKYIYDLLERCNILDVKPISSPIDSSVTKAITAPDPSYSDPSAYRHVVDSLQYVTITRLELSFAVNRACQHMHHPLTSHWRHVKRILRYLKGTLDHGLTLSASRNCDLVVYSDAGWATDPIDLRSQHGYVVFYGGNLVSWASRKQKVLARSSTEAEYRALAFATIELVWFCQLLQEIRQPLRSKPVLLCDNLSATFLANNPAISTRSKHIQLDYHFVRQKVESGQLLVRHSPAQDQLADILTKALTGRYFTSVCPKLSVTPRPSACRGY